MFDPSLVLLIFKTIAIFLISLATGWSLHYKRFTDLLITNWVLNTVLGAAFLCFTSLWAVLLGYNGAYGLIPVAILFLLKVSISIYRGIKYIDIDKAHIKSVFAAVCLLSAISSLNYFAPFLVENTSGYYSRGGGDHSTYLVLSDYYSKHSFWEQINNVSPTPPQKNWEAEKFAFDRSKLNVKNIQPYANQLIATPYMSILGGSNEETYSAVVAFYVSMAIWSVIALIMLLLKPNRIKWLFFLPLFLSNLVIYNASTHSIPYLLNIALINCIMMLFWIYTRNGSWQSDINEYKHYLPLGVLCSSLLAIYPHGYLIVIVFLTVMAITSSALEEFKRFITLGVMSLIFSFAAVNFILFTNIPLMLGGMGGSFPFSITSSLPEIITAQTGVVDILSYSKLNAFMIFVFLSLFLSLFVLAWKVIVNSQPRVRWFLAALLLIPWLGIVYYAMRGGSSYQVVRFLELVHLYLLAFAGYGAIYILERTRKSFIVRSFLPILFLSVVSFELITHSHTVNEIINVDPVFGTEFRDSTALNGINHLQKIQNSSKEINHIAYYFGPGDGVDFAGGSVLLRDLYYLPARGNTLASFFDSYLPGTHTRVWKKEWLDNAFLVIRPEGKVDIIEDTRTGAFSEPLLDTKRLKIYDSSKQPLTQLVGDSWGGLLFYPYRKDVNAKPYRFLQRETGAIVIWSEKKHVVHLSLYLNSDSPDTQIQLQSNLFKENSKNFNVPVWDHKLPSKPTVSLDLDLDRGANVIEVKSKKQGYSPSLFFWKVVVT